MYGNEASLGSGILSSGVPRSQLYITTKFHKLEPGQTVRESLKASLERLQVEYVDLFLMHTPMGWGSREDSEGKSESEGKSGLKEVWRECEEVKREGLARSVGVSNFRERELEEVMQGRGIVPAVNQVCPYPHPNHPSIRLSITLILAKDRISPPRPRYHGVTPRLPRQTRHRDCLLRRPITSLQVEECHSGHRALYCGAEIVRDGG